MPEDQIETTEQQTTTDGAATRDDLIAAVREAAGAEGGAAPAEPAEPQEKPEPAAAEPAATAEPDPDAKLAEILKRREEGHAKRRDAEAYAEQVRRQAEAEKQQLLEEARAEARRIFEAEQRALKERFRTSPTQTLRELGDPDEIVDAVLKDGTPEARALAKAQEEARLARELAAEGKTAREELAQFKAEQLREKQQALYSAARDSFLTEHANAEKAPYMNARWDADEVFQRCDALCREWESDGMVLGRDFDKSTLVAYLEKQSRDRFAKTVPGTAQQVSAAGSATSQGVATKVTANGSRTLAAAAGSERRTSPRPYHEMTPDEQRQALIDEVAAAKRAFPDATS